MARVAQPVGGSGVTQGQDVANPDGKASVGQHLKGIPDAVEVAGSRAFRR